MPSFARRICALLPIALAWFVLAVPAACTWATEHRATQSLTGNALSTLAQSWINGMMQADTAAEPPNNHGHQSIPLSANLPLRMQVRVGPVDARLRLAACNHIEPYLPPGTRLWGRARIGLRCLNGPVRWNVFVPITVHAFGPAWVLARNVAAGTQLTEQDAMPAEVDWAAAPSSIVARAQDWAGQITTRPLAAGQALRQNMLRPPTSIRTGAQVRVVALGPGYALSASGQAMHAGSIGKNLRVRMSNGHIVTGIVAQDGTVHSAL